MAQTLDTTKMTPIKITQEQFDRDLQDCLEILQVTPAGYVCEYIDPALYKRNVLIQIVQPKNI